MSQTLPQHGAQPGDLMEISRGMYEEWAIYVGNDEVVHLILKGGKPIVKCSNIWKLVGYDRFKVNNVLDGECKPRKPDDIVKEARQMVGKEWSCSWTSQIPGHFVKELRYGNAESGKRQHGAKPGDLIEIERGVFQHWAVYVGGDDVVHFTNLGSGSTEGSGISGASGNMLEQVVGLGQVTRDNIWKVIDSSCFKVNNLLDNECKPHDPKVIVKEALAKVGQKLSYSVASFNCEHFATLLRYGMPESRQVKHASGSLFPSFSSSRRVW
ncbi:phospholipase A and acyltransferase 1-like [Cheilinus undulatus]|uniref:phospholipase A and acyltransferase 1-like n=1 Tax=Cheilinus undulatus TaxID=241271 RepID=UPI001BD32B4E|nr:phospholipase A and acyltransferase 1-like [Cheilinus undulatus]